MVPPSAVVGLETHLAPGNLNRAVRPGKITIHIMS